VSEIENVFVFPDCETSIWSVTGIANVKQRTQTYCASALSCHVNVFFLFHLNVTLTLNES